MACKKQDICTRSISYEEVNLSAVEANQQIKYGTYPTSNQELKMGPWVVISYQRSRGQEPDEKVEQCV